MGFWGRFFGRQSASTDPVFGPLRCEEGTWHAEVVFPPTDGVLPVWGHGPDSGPSEEQRTLFTQLVERYPSLKQDIQAALFKEYAEYAGASSSGELRYRPAKGPEDMDGAAPLSAIEIYGSHTSQGPELILHHDMFFWHPPSQDWERDEHELNVVLEDWHVKEVLLEG